MRFVHSLCLLPAFASMLHAAQLPTGFVEEVLADHLNAATAMTALPDGRVLIADQTGMLRVIKDGRMLATPTLDLRARVDSYWERGLVGVTAHPDFPHTPELFVLYVAAQPYPHHVLARFVVAGDIALPETEHILFEGDDQTKRGGKYPAGHQGGPVRFGPDGKLYVALGEPLLPTEGPCSSQKLDTVLGKILRFKPDGTVPEDNPFYRQTTGKYRAIWAIGLRNPFGMAFQPETGRLFACDVGQSSWEEIDDIIPGANYGWPDAEGMSTNPAFKNPIHTYPPTVGRCIIGGSFYPRAAPAGDGMGFFPEAWRGKFFFADWAANWVKVLDPDKPASVTTFATGFKAPVGVLVAPDHSLLVLNRNTIWRDGKNFAPDAGSLVRIRYAGPGAIANAAPESPIPKRLSEAGVFKSLVDLQTKEGFSEFVINAPPWQPGVRARRWISIPAGQAIQFSGNSEWQFPTGTVIVQHYAIETTGVPFETHILHFTGPRTATATAYRWDANGRNATLVEDTGIVPLPGMPGRRWLSPGFERQLNLDAVVCGFVLPVNSQQMHIGHQLEDWNARGWFQPKLRDEDIATLPRLARLDDESAPPELRVRSYLDVNCSACHHPGGPSRGLFDARFCTPLHEQKLLNGDLMAGDLGIAGAHVIQPGDPEKSVMLQHLKRSDAFRMPQVSVNDEPQPILPVLEAWIRSLAPMSAP